MKPLLRQLRGYAAASALALAVDFAVLASLVHFAGCGYLVAAMISFLLGAYVAYELSIRLAFKRHRLANQRAELVAFVAIGAVGLAINTAVIFVAINYMALHYLVAKGLAAGVTFLCNFVARRQLLFVQRA